MTEPKYFPNVPSGPLLDGGEQKIRKWGFGQATYKRLGVADRTIREWREARNNPPKGRPTVEWTKADQILTNIGLHWWDVWTPTNTTPEQYEDVLIAFTGECGRDPCEVKDCRCHKIRRSLAYQDRREQREAEARANAWLRLAPAA
jgi:hypothetical protein